MTQNANGISLKKSKRFTELNGVKFPNLPSANKLVEGELAINYAKGLETISTKNESGTVVTFSSDDYYSEKKLGSGFTGTNSAKTVTEAIEEIQPNVNADWDEQDETSPAFILNKPFGDSCEYVTAYENTFIASSIGSDHYGIGGFSFSGAGTTFRHGDTYRVTIDEDVYVLNAVYWGGSYLGLNIEEGASSPYTDTWSIFNAGANAFGSTQIQSGDEVYLKIEQLICTTTLIDNKYVNSSWEKGTGANSVKLINNGGTASGSFSVSEGSGTSASTYAHAEGFETKASGERSHSEGYQTIASGSSSHAEGEGAKANAGGSHAEGGITEANGTYSHAEGWTTFANGSYSHTEGAFTQTNKGYSHAEGYSTFTRNEYEHASGRYNNSVSASTIFGDSGNTLFSVGNGEQNSRHNAFEIRQNGDIYIVDKAGQDVKLQDKLIDANNYYTKSETSGKTELSNAFAQKLNISDFNTYSGTVNTTINSKASQSDLNTLSGTVTGHTANTSIHLTSTQKENIDSLEANIAAISGITSTKVSNWDGAVTNSHTHTNKSVLDGISSSDITNWNSKTSNVGTVTSVQIGLPTGLSAATTAITESGKFDVKFSDGYSIPTTLKQGQWDEAYTAKHSHSNKSNLDSITSNVGTMAYQNATSYSSATEVQTALGKKSDTGHTHVKADITDFPAINDGTFTISGNGASVVSTSANASANKGLNIKSSTNVTITTGASEITIAATDTTYTAGSFVTITGSNNSINVTTGTTSSSVSRGDHNHDSVYTKITDSEAMEQTLVAAITDIDSRAADKEELKALVNDYQDFKLMYENRRERKRFTNRDDFFANLRRAAADQNLERYGFKVGDYLNYNGHDYVIAGLNTMRGPVSNYRVTTDHIGLIVIPHATQAWNVSGNTHQSTYTYSTDGSSWTTGAAAGYANCDLHHYMTETLLPIVNTDLGSYASGLLAHNKLYSTAVNTSGYNRFGSAGGCSSSWAWYSNQKICALSEVQVYGSIVWSSSGYDTGEACRQLDVFRVYNMNEIFGGEYPWLRDVASASNACNVNNNGHAYHHAASYALSVAALILFA